MKSKTLEVIVAIIQGLAMIAVGPVVIAVVIVKSIYEILRDGFVEFAKKGQDNEE